MGRQFNIAEAKARLSELADAASRGEEIVLARHGKPIARIAPLSGAASSGLRKLGQLAPEGPPVDLDTWWREWKAGDRAIAALFKASAPAPLEPVKGKAGGKARRRTAPKKRRGR